MELKRKGYFWIGVYHPKYGSNIGTLWRSAHILGASAIFTIGKRYKFQATDTTRAWKHVPLLHFSTFKDFKNSLPYKCKLIGLERSENAIDISNFEHPNRSCYLLGAEDYGLCNSILKQCDNIVRLPGQHCLNVSTAGSITMFHRIIQKETQMKINNEIEI